MEAGRVCFPQVSRGGVWPIGRAPGSGPGGRGFNSLHPDKTMSEQHKEAVTNFFIDLFNNTDTEKDVLDDAGFGSHQGSKKPIDEVARLGSLSIKFAKMYKTSEKIGTVDWYKELAQKAQVNLPEKKPGWWIEEEKRDRQ